MNIQEIILRKTIPVVINSFNQPTYLKNIIDKFILNSFKNIYILDNKSSRLDLLELYDKFSELGITVIYYNENNGPRHFHLSGLYQLFGNTPHIYSDPDIDFDLLDVDYVSTLLHLSNFYKIAKVGSSLEIPSEEFIKNNLWFLQHNGVESVKISLPDWEKRFWTNELENEVYLTGIDTTLHLFNPIHYMGTNYFHALRVAKPGYVVRHLPWYKNDIMSQYEKNYYRTEDLAGWGNY